MTENTADKLAFLALGWLLGLLAPVIVDAIKHRRENTLGRTAILSELAYVACMLATAAYGVRSKQGTIDRRFLEWLRNDLAAHSVSDQFRAFVPKLDKQLAWSDDELNKAGALLANPEGIGMVLQHYPVSLLDARVSAMWTFDTNFQRDLLAIRQEIHLLDDLVERSRKYFDQTFSNLDGDNYQPVQDNFTQACALYAERAQRTVDRIRSLVKAAR